MHKRKMLITIHIPEHCDLKKVLFSDCLIMKMLNSQGTYFSEVGIHNSSFSICLQLSESAN